MILPSKHISSDRALLTVGAQVLGLLDRPRTVSHVWDSLRMRQERSSVFAYDWFILSLDLLFMLGAVEYQDGLLVKAKS
jgi:hypothetical protein